MYHSAPNDTAEFGIYRADSTQAVLAVPDASIDLCICDPPYGISFRSNHSHGQKRFKMIIGDEVVDGSWLPHVHRVLKDGAAAYIWTRWDVYPAWAELVRQAGFTIKNCLVWDKGGHGAGDLEGSWGYQHEFCIFAVKGRHLLLSARRPDILVIPKVPPAQLLHPNQKPLGVIRPLISASSRPGDTVLDLFAGSGTVPVACREMGRRWLAFEYEEQWCSLARQRTHSAQPALWADAPKMEQRSMFGGD